MRKSLSGDVVPLVAWLEDSLTPFLAEHAPDQIGSLKADALRLAELSSHDDETVVCFLGTSGVGKSTLINALVAGDRVILPAGGIGPLTALATKVRYSEVPYFRAKYHKPGYLRNLLFPLWTQLQKEHAKAGTTSEAVVDDAIATEVAEEDEERSVSRSAEFKKVARQLVTGDQFSDEPIEYVLDALSTAMSEPARFGNTVQEIHAEAVARLSEALKAASSDREFKCLADSDERAFHEELRRHAAGHLSPIISEIDVGWPSDVLRDGLVLVDLPGIGVASDRYRAATQKYVRDQARAVVVVVDRAGVTESLLELLRTSGYWDRVVGAAYDPQSDPCELMIAVAKVDEVAHAEFQALKSLPPSDRPKRWQVYDRISTEMVDRIRHQTADQLGHIGQSENESVNEARAAAREHVLKTLSVHPVSAVEYTLCLADDEDDPPRIIKNAEQSRIPRFQEHIIEVGAKAAARREALMTEVRSRLLRSAESELQLIGAQWEGDERVASEVVRLRAALEEVMKPWTKEFENRRGAYRGYLQEAVPILIEQLILEAREAAEHDVSRYLRGMREYHWATLRAAVARGGTFKGSRHIDLPGDISDRFQEPMAAVWGQKLLRDIRKQTKNYANDCERLVGYICDWARENGAAVTTDVIDSQESRIKDQAAQLHQVGKEASDELRDVVRKELRKAIESPIRKRCEKFVEDGDHVGRGVKNRILDMFEDLSRQATKAAEAPSRKILNKRFSEVRDQVANGIKNWPNPLQDAADAIVDTSAQRQKRSDAQRRRRVLTAVDELRDTLSRLKSQEAA